VDANARCPPPQAERERAAQERAEELFRQAVEAEEALRSGGGESKATANSGGANSAKPRLEMINLPAPKPPRRLTARERSDIKLNLAGKARLSCHLSRGRTGRSANRIHESLLITSQSIRPLGDCASACRSGTRTGPRGGAGAGAGYSPGCGARIDGAWIDTPEAARAFLNPRLSDLIDPFELEGMELAAQRVARALRDHERICVFGDYDADGLTATAVMLLTLRALGGDAFHYIPHRLREDMACRPRRWTFAPRAEPN
jgi:hypothetical protein